MPGKYDACMFCTEEEPCDSHKPKATKKKATPRKKAVPAKQAESTPGIPTSPPVPATQIDLKAAMKAAAQQAALDKPEPVERRTLSSRQKTSDPDSLVDLSKPTVDARSAMQQAASNDTGEDDLQGLTVRWVRRSSLPKPDDEPDPELVRAVAVLAPILHPSEERKLSKIFSRPDFRAIRWKLRNRSDDYSERD